MMKLKNDQELVNTRAKLQRLEEIYRETTEDTSENPRVREISMRSLKRLINQLKEEIAVFEAHPAAKR